MSLTTADQANFKTLLRAVGNKHIALTQCTDAATGKPVATICAVIFNGKDYSLTPLATMVQGNPYETLLPPSV